MPATNSLDYLKIVARHHQGDCGIVALAQLLGVSYEDVLEKFAGVTDAAHKKGVYVTQIMQVAELLGTPLKRKRKFDAEEACGILSLKCAKNRFDKEHVALLRWGLVFDHQKDGQGEVWEYDPYMSHYGGKATCILVRADE